MFLKKEFGLGSKICELCQICMTPPHKTQKSWTRISILSLFMWLANSFNVFQFCVRKKKLGSKLYGRESDPQNKTATNKQQQQQQQNTRL